MDIIKLLVVFCTIIIVMWKKQPLLIAVSIASIVAILIYGLSPQASLLAIKEGITSSTTIQTLVVFYLITFLQRMLEKRQNLKGCQFALNGLFNNRRINVAVVPFLLGCLPAASTVLICGPIVRDSVEGYLPRDTQAAITSYFRHISEAFLPTYTSIFIAISLTDGLVTIHSFLIAMIPVIFALFFFGYFIYLKKIPKDTGQIAQESKKYYWKLLIQSIWTIVLSIFLILALGLTVYVAVFVCIVLNFFVNKFTFREIIPFVKSAFETKLMISTVLVMIFKEILSATGVIQTLPEFFSTLPIPMFVVYSLIFFFGTFVAGSQAIIVMCMPMAMASLGTASALPLFILLMAVNYSAMQLSPVHICLTMCAEDFKVTLGQLIFKTMPLVLSVISASVLYYFILNIIF